MRFLPLVIKSAVKEVLLKISTRIIYTMYFQVSHFVHLKVEDFFICKNINGCVFEAYFSGPQKQLICVDPAKFFCKLCYSFFNVMSFRLFCTRLLRNGAG